MSVFFASGRDLSRHTSEINLFSWRAELAALITKPSTAINRTSLKTETVVSPMGSKRLSPDRIGSDRIYSHYTPPPGAGSAKLSYVLLQKLLKLSEYLPRRREAGSGTTGDADKGPANGNSCNGDDAGSGGGGGGRGFCFKYVITDFSHANFGFWMNHPRLQELFALGIVDFAVFDAEAERGETPAAGAESDADGSGLGGVTEIDRGAAAAADGSGGGDSNGSGRNSSGGGGGPGVGLWGSGSSACLRLELSGEELRPGDLDNPVIVVANYVFDSLKQDAFRCDAMRRGEDDFWMSRRNGAGRISFVLLFCLALHCDVLNSVEAFCISSSCADGRKAWPLAMPQRNRETRCSCRADIDTVRHGLCEYTRVGPA